MILDRQCIWLHCKFAWIHRCFFILWKWSQSVSGKNCVQIVFINKRINEITISVMPWKQERCYYFISWDRVLSLELSHWFRLFIIYPKVCIIQMQVHSQVFLYTWSVGRVESCHLDNVSLFKYRTKVSLMRTVQFASQALLPKQTKLEQTSNSRVQSDCARLLFVYRFGQKGLGGKLDPAPK